MIILHTDSELRSSPTMSFVDPYTFRARVQPAFIAVLPLGTFLFALLPDLPLFITAFCGLLGAAGVTAVVAQVGRELGSRKERNLWDSWDGPPTTRLLRHRRLPGDISLEPGLRQQVEEWIGYPLPTEQEEGACPEWADAQYGEAVRSLRDVTRYQAKFPLVFAENVNYGFRRNLWGLKPIGMPIAVGLFFVSWTLLMLTTWGRPWPDPWWDVFVNPDSAAVIRLAVAVVGTAFAAFWLIWVKPSWVKVAANAYALRLLESVQTLRSP